ncbi:hypothetical protein TRFO_25020 [Tritrichomonas foetus]|uniref:DUF3447 domain-containing protein n=1 Tax=Tritrichomonas foetus TaxID=1144522 RepID=A0A1J4K777_9EUKA|nr:hypothetical protein TRFO_25020 [Tritrichomonas foetus]|eukprot:OHT06850.1 hypothetical protein TRFO_25020 [Tritrichomonas foetus]
MDLRNILAQYKDRAENISKIQNIIFSCNVDNFEESKEAILQSPDLLSREPFRHVLASLGVAFNTRPLDSDLIIKLILAVSTKAKEFFNQSELYNIFCVDLSNFFLFQLISNDIISFESLLYIPHNESDDFLVYFAPEFMTHQRIRYENEIKQLMTIDLEEHIVLRAQGVNDSRIAQCIRQDIIDEFVDIVSRTNLPLDSKIPYSLYERCIYISDSPSIIEYAAFFGAVDIFKYLITNKVRPSSNLTYFAVAGGNIEIVHLCEQMKCDFSDAVDAALLFHRDEILDYIFGLGYEYTKKSFLACIEGYNYGHFYNVFNDQTECNNFTLYGDTPLIYSLKHMFAEFGIAFCSLSGVDFNRTDVVFI